MDYQQGGNPYSSQGGFVNTPGSDHTPQKPKRSSDKKTPVSIVQLLSAEPVPGDEGSFTILDRVPLSQITLVARIVSVEPKSTFNMFQLEDGSGQIPCQVYSDLEQSEAQMARNDSLRLGTYVRVFGHVNTFQGHKQIKALNIRPIEDFNEVVYHDVEIIHFCLHSQQKLKSARPGARQPQQQQQQQQQYSQQQQPHHPQQPQQQHYYDPPPQHHQPQHQPQPQHYDQPYQQQQQYQQHNPQHQQQPRQQAPPPTQKSYNGWTPQSPCERAVIDYIESMGRTPAGFNIRRVEEHFSGRFTFQDLRACFEVMSAQSIVFNTIDDDTFQLTS